LDSDPNTPDNIVILNNKDLLDSIDGYELNDGKKHRKQKRIRLNYPFKYQRDELRGTTELKAFNTYYNLPLSIQARMIHKLNGQKLLKGKQITKIISNLVCM
jgi:hypothetical protein